MWQRPLSRRALLGLAGGALASALLGKTIGEGSEKRIGVVLPSARDEFRFDSTSVEIAGNSARKGAVLAEEELGGAGGAGAAVRVIYAAAPNAAAADRAARRLGSDSVFALVGGFGEGQARSMSRVAKEHQSLFLNIGSASESLRARECNRYMFHVEASAGMYLAGLVNWFNGSGQRRWFIVHSRDEEGHAQLELARREIGRWGTEASLIGTSAVGESADYRSSLSGIRDAGPDVVLLLLGWREQLEFLGQFDAYQLGSEVTGFPHPVTQTYRFATSLQRLAPRTALGHRVILWSPRLESDGAEHLNSRFFARWGLPMDAPAWCAYQAIAILYQAVVAVGEANGRRLGRYLESDSAVFDVGKGEGVSFGASNHQLRQPLYVARTGSAARPDASPLAVVSRLSQTETRALLDSNQIGEAEAISSCRS